VSGVEDKMFVNGVVGEEQRRIQAEREKKQ
jgi:hypothetical protein